MTREEARYTDADVDAAKRSVDLAQLIGGSVALKRNGDEWKGLCPFHNENTPSFTVVPKKYFYHCFGCGAHGDAISWLQQQERLSFADAIEKLGQGQAMPGRRPPVAVTPKPVSAEVDKEREKKIAAALKIWKESKPAKGTIVEKYLISRGLIGVALPASIRFHSACWNAEKSGLYPAMIGAVMDREARRIIAVHRTYLKPDGSGKADMENAKKILGPYRGGHLRLDIQHNGRLAVAEGIETAMSVKKSCPQISVWAALSLNNMDAPIPREVTELILCADADNKDQISAERILQNATKLFYQAGRIVRIARPAPGKDFNDMMRCV